LLDAQHSLDRVHQGSGQGQDKDKLVETYRQQFSVGEVVVLVGVAQEKAKAWAATKKFDGRRVHLTFNWHTVYVNHYYIYLIDRDWGPAFIKVCGYAPYAVKVCLNAHVRHEAPSNPSGDERARPLGCRSSRTKLRAALPRNREGGREQPG
jgi:hypothetical protein